MAYRNVFVSSAAKLSLKNNQLIVFTNMEYTIPIEDISTLLIESSQVNVSSALISKLSDNGVCIFFCDEKHTPNGVLIPFNVHSRKLKVLQLQLEIKKPLQKSIWQDIVVQKIINQGKVLKLCGKETYKEIVSISQKVLSDDVSNMEAVSASKYFKDLFGSGFSRGQDIVTNARLNYGYAILRGAIARSLVVYGLEPCIGVHHKSQLNAYNLADDIIEVFRPMVDLAVYNLETAQPQENENLSVKDKQILYNLLSCDVVSAGEIHQLS
ncbi:MAG: type II CRISPR-associated endonuclease Cas1, partial [Oscillospiraceae bacterium]